MSEFVQCVVNLIHVKADNGIDMPTTLIHATNLSVNPDTCVKRSHIVHVLHAVHAPLTYSDTAHTSIVHTSKSNIKLSGQIRVWRVLLTCTSSTILIGNHAKHYRHCLPWS